MFQQKLDVALPNPLAGFGVTVAGGVVGGFAKIVPVEFIITLSLFASLNLIGKHNVSPTLVM